MPKNTRSAGFQSRSQRAFLFAKHPEVAKKFARETPKSRKLPLHKRR